MTAVPMVCPSCGSTEIQTAYHGTCPSRDGAHLHDSCVCGADWTVAPFGAPAEERMIPKGKAA